MFDWTAQTKDPSNKQVGRQLQAFLVSLTAFYTGSRADFLRDYFHNMRVLDIGAGEHDPSYYREDRWEHGIITKVAAYSLGVDINQEVCDHYTAKGYQFRCVDATSQTDLGERFDRVFMGDVVEHVNNPVALLQFGKRHLNTGGRILLSTPNPFALSYLTGRRRRGDMPFFIVNFEHTCWVTPTNANELARRAGLQFTRMYFSKPDWAGVRTPKAFLKRLGQALLRMLNLEELAHKEFIYEFSV